MMEKLIIFCGKYLSKAEMAIYDNRVKIKKWSIELAWIGAVSVSIYNVILFRNQLYTYFCDFGVDEYIPLSRILVASSVICTLIALWIFKLAFETDKSIVITFCWINTIKPIYVGISRLILWVFAYCILFIVLAYFLPYLLNESHMSINGISQMMVAHTFSIILLSTLLGTGLINILHKWFGFGLIVEPMYSAKFYQAVIYSFYFIGGVIVMVLNLEESSISDNIIKMTNSLVMSLSAFLAFLAMQKSWRQFLSSKTEDKKNRVLAKLGTRDDKT